MTDVQDQAAFDAEIASAREADEAYDGPEAEGAEGGEEEHAEPSVEERLTRAEQIAADKSKAFKAERAIARRERERANELEARLAKLERGGADSDDIDFSKIASVDDDPLGNIEAVRKLAEKMVRDRQADGAREAQERTFQQINQRMTEYEADFRLDNPDYDDAAKFLGDSIKDDLAEQGYTGADLDKEFRNQLVGMVARAVQAGKDPAEVAYALANRRGFGAKKTPTVDTGAKKLQGIAEGQKANKTLTGAGAKQGSGELDASSVYRLEGAAFDAAFAKLRQQARKAS